MRKNGISQRIPASPRKLVPDGKGHLTIRLRRNGEGKPFFVHRLVMAAFVGPCPDGMVVCHNNGNGLDNRLDNLRYDTQSENMNDTKRHGTNHWANKKYCKWGHLLDAPNLVESSLKGGPTWNPQRRCKSCTKAKDKSRRDEYVKAHIREYADSIYMKMTGSSPVRLPG